MRRTGLLCALWAAAALLGCGGGGGGGGSGGSPATPAADYPVVTQSGTFAFPALQSPPERVAASATLEGRVLVAPQTPPPAGTGVALVDASTGAVTARAVTAADGSFSLGTPTLAGSPPDRLVRVQLSDGTVLRAFAVGWTELTPGSEVAVSELQRLRVAGAFVQHVWAAADLAILQDALSLKWQAMAAAPSAAAAVDRLRADIRQLAPWNKLLDRLGDAQPLAAGFDVAGLLAVNTASTPSVVTTPLGTGTATYTSNCVRQLPTDAHRICIVQAPGQPDLGDGYRLEADRLLVSLYTGVAAIDALQGHIGDLPLLEFPGLVGTKVLFNQPQIDLASNPQVHASARVVRRTYPPAPLSALGGTVPAVQVVMDYELATLNTVTRASQSVLMRVKRWFSPQAGLVRLEIARWVQDGATVTTWAGQMVAQSASGSFFDPDVLPSPGVADVRALALMHRHAVFVPATNRVWVGTSDNGGQLLELDADTLATVRSTALPAVPGRLAVSADGARLYAGLDGGVLLELRMSDLATLRRTPLPTDPNGIPYARVLDMQVDPRRSGRVLMLLGGNSFGGSGAVMLVTEGVLELRDSPVYFATDYGWGYYSPNAIRWTSAPDEFLAASYSSPSFMYRFGAGAGAFSELARLERVTDVGLDETAGEVLTGQGNVLDASTLAPRRSLGLGAVPLKDCRLQGRSSVLCGIRNLAESPPFLLHLNLADSAFLGTYRPAITTAFNGCPGTGVRVGSFGLDGMVLTPMDGARNLVATLPTGNGDWCALHVWSLHGVAR